ncbi:cell invasion protein [Pseudomonas sp. Irchel 3F5]|uniref:cell invasion protein n=1 Tax=Pseudomonas sp. Irchel 3F5 TaxID=2009002 RepID=UPI000BA477BC|nr:cell invasion protein [Pseudomonas sp. Irchel 3F5]
MTTINAVAAVRPVFVDGSSHRDALRDIASVLDSMRLGQGQVLASSVMPLAFSSLDQVVQLMASEDSSAVDELASQLSERVLDTLDTLSFDPGAWEAHANILRDALLTIMAVLIANAASRGQFATIVAKVAEQNAQAIIDGGQAQYMSAISGAVLAGAMSIGGATLSFKGLAAKHADISTTKRTAMDANNIGNDLTAMRARTDFEPGVPTKVRTLNDKGAPHDAEFIPKGAKPSTDELAWFDREILKARKQAQESEWLGAMNEKGYMKPQLYGQLITSLAMTVSNAVSSAVRLGEYQARSREVLLQSAQGLVKNLADEVAQKNGGDTGLLNKLMDMVLQLLQSRASASAIR